MKKFLLVTSAIVAAGPVFAADLPLKAPPMAAVAPFTLSGCHVGGHIGGATDRVNYSDPGTMVPPGGVFPVGGVNQNFAPLGASFTTTGQPTFLGGVQAGCDYQFDNHLVIGIGGDFSWTNLGSVINDPFFGGKNGNPITLSTRTDQIATVTGRVGYAFDNVLFYGKGGAAFAHDRFAVNNVAFFNQAVIGCSDGITNFGCNATGSADRWGWTAGFGVEWALDTHWSAMVEFDHYGFDSKTVAMSVINNNFAVTPANLATKHDIDTVKIGINYRFWSPVAARY
jgi:outer membrane immunogenic protein